MDNQNIGEMTEKTLTKIKEMVDVNTVIGDAINCPDGTTVIPFSRVTLGYGGGGGNYSFTSDKLSGAAGTGLGVKIDPVGFLVISEGNVRLLNIEGSSNSAVDKIADALPMVINKVDGFIQNRKAGKAYSE